MASAAVARASTQSTLAQGLRQKVTVTEIADHVDDLERSRHGTIFLSMEFWAPEQLAYFSSMVFTYLYISPRRRLACLYAISGDFESTVSFAWVKQTYNTHRPMMALFSPISRRSSRSSHMLGYPILTSSTSTVSSVKPARLIRFDISRGSRPAVMGEPQSRVGPRTCHW